MYANFAPLITATLTVAIFLLSLFSLKTKGVLKALFVLSIITVVISLLPLMYGLNYYTLVGAFITVTLVRNCLFKCPEEVVGRGHQKCAVFNRIFLISAKRWIRVFLGYAVEAFYKCFQL